MIPSAFSVIRSTSEGIVLDVRVIPRAGRSGIAGTRDGALLVRLTASPVEGAANDELIEVMAKALRVPKRQLTIIAGQRSRHKRIKVEEISVGDARMKLGV